MKPDTSTCADCLFYRICGDDTGTCEITDNIVEPTQEACNNHIKNSNE